MPKIGAHVSVAGGIYKCVENAQKIGAETIQIFGSSPRQWNTKIPSSKDVVKYKHLLKESGIGPVFLHASYLVNLSGANAELTKKSVNNLVEHLKIAELLGAEGLIFHIGSGGGLAPTPISEEIGVSSQSERGLVYDEILAKTTDAINKVLHDFFGSANLIMENSAGGGQKLGKTVKELEELFFAVGSSRVKVCIDTAHAFEAGILEYDTESIKKFFGEIGSKIGLENLVALHINDSKTLFNSRHDRHENIGRGHIGLEGFKNLAKENTAREIPWILEVPGFDGKGPDRENVEIIKNLFDVS